MYFCDKTQMMKKILSFIILFSISMLLKSQTGNVGVNTISPTHTLDVNGTFRVRKITQVGSSQSAKDSIMVFDEDGVAHLIEKYIFSAFIGLSTSLDKINDNLKDTLMHSLGMKFTVAEEDHVEAIMPVDIRTRQPFGILHGGATLALAETVAGFGSNLLCNEGEFVVGMQVSGNHISSAREGDTVTAIAKVIHKGRSTHIWNVDVVSSMGKLISSIRVMNSILKKR